MNYARGNYLAKQTIFGIFDFSPMPAGVLKAKNSEELTLIFFGKKVCRKITTNVMYKVGSSVVY